MLSQALKAALLGVSTALIVIGASPYSAASSGAADVVPVTASKHSVTIEDDGSYFVTGKQSGYLVVGGSSTCPPEPNGALYKDNVLAINFKKSDKKICTADYGMFTFDVSSPKLNLNASTRVVVVSGEDVTEIQTVVENR